MNGYSEISHEALHTGYFWNMRVDGERQMTWSKVRWGKGDCDSPIVRIFYILGLGTGSVPNAPQEDRTEADWSDEY